MNHQKIRKVVAMIGIFTLLSGIFSGCKPHKEPEEIIDGPGHTVPGNYLTFDDLGASLTGLYMTHQGMARGPYYIFKQTEDGIFMKTTDTDPKYLSIENPDGAAADPRFNCVDMVLEEEYASLVQLEDDGIVRELETAIENADALSWDGWNEKSNPGRGLFHVADSGDSYDLYLELSDGTSVTMHGSDTHPDSWGTLYFAVSEIFEENSDYSYYMAENFTDSPCTALFANFYGANSTRTNFKLTLVEGSRWSVELHDPEGRVLEQGTDLSGYQSTEDKLPFDRFLDIMSQYHAEQWNGWEKTDAEATESNLKFDIMLFFEDDKEYRVTGNVYPEGFGEFSVEFIREIQKFYEEQVPAE